MFISYAIIAILLAAVLSFSARGKLVRDERVVKPITAVGVPLSWFPFLAACEIAGAVGLLVGLFIAPLGIAAAIGVILYFVGATVAHVRAGDVKNLGAPAVLLAVAVATLVLRIASA